MSVDKTDPIPFNTHRFVKRMVGAGMPEQQAEILADEQVNLLNSNLATKTDIVLVKADIAQVRAEIEKVRADLMKFMLSAMGVQTAAIVLLIKFLG